MKSYNEMANNVLSRIEQLEFKERNRRRTMKKLLIPIYSFCLIMLLGVGLWQGGLINDTPTIKPDDSNIIGENNIFNNEDSSNNNNVIDVIGTVKYNGATYMQCSTNAKAYTPGKYLGKAYDFEGTYQTHLKEGAGGLYMTNEDPNVLMVEVESGGYSAYVFLFKEQIHSN